MVIWALAENTTSNSALSCEHGLALYIETTKHKILFDTGASRLFADNASVMGIDLSKVDIAVISHGHHDHGGGLKTFLTINSQAKIYIHQNAFDKHYGIIPNDVMEDIGLDMSLLQSERFVFTGDQIIIDDELELFSDVWPIAYYPAGNKDLYMKNDGRIVNDDFEHEQNLVISESGKAMLITGCAHKGIINIVDRFFGGKNTMPECIIGGFHLFNPSFKKSEDASVTDAVGKYLLNTKALCFTCHCTGIESYERLRSIMGDRIRYLSTGQKITI
jgi:7,8-dihydropterin-6-yl-methyl-4-(beta-D-ribofuranosyl)aminobenzene 5'-phosphate synthase